MTDLRLLVPSRGRPGNIERLMASMDRTCRADTQLIVGLDDDDPELPRYLELDCVSEVTSGMRQVVAVLNHLARTHTHQCPHIGHAGDDNEIRTIGWDVRVIEALQRVPFCFGDDEYPGRPAGSLSCHIFMRSEIVTALGYMGPPSIRHMYVDPIWFEWGQAVGIEFLADVKIPHLHYSAGRSEFDATYEAALAQTDRDLAAFNAYRANDLDRDIGRLRACLTRPSSSRAATA